MDLAAELAAFDGTHTDGLEAAAARLIDARGAVQALCALAGDVDLGLEVPATWVLKRLQEEGVAITPAQSDVLLALLCEVSSWEARLHLLQMVPGLIIGEARVATLRGRLEQLVGDGRPFVRAWAYHALAVLADQHPELRPSVSELLVQGQDDERASVRARIRNTRKAMPWALPRGD